MEALHSSTTLGGTQWYIGCAQIKVTGPGGSCNPSIQLPGAYKASDPNIYISDFYYGFNVATFTAPGGPVATCAGGSGGGGAATTSTKTTTTTTSRGTTLTTKTTSTPAATTTGGSSPGTIPLYGQCGGNGWTGATTCVSGAKCSKQNDYYAQCVPA